MKNSEMFEKELEELARTPERQTELARLRDQLRHVAAQDGSSGQEQAWAWTRLQARLREEEESESHAMGWLPYFKWAALGAIGLFMVSLFVRFQTEPSGLEVASLSPPAALAESVPSAEEPRLPTVAMANPDMHAVSFHSSEAAADVIWATGYTYLPASFDPR
jgi:hypothetical protein